MKLFKTWKSKLPAYLIIPAASIAAATSFGLISFSDNSNNNGKPPKAISLGERFFDKKIAPSSSSSLKTNILYPQGGINLFEKIVFLEDKFFSNNAQELSVLKFRDGKKKPLYSFNFDLKDSKTYKDVVNKFKNINKKINDFIIKDENQDILDDNRFAIHFYKDNYRRQIFVELYELSSDSKRKQIAQKFVDNIYNNHFKIPQNDDFLSAIWSPILILKKNVEDHMGYSKMPIIPYKEVKYNDKNINAKTLTFSYSDIYEGDAIKKTSIFLPNELIDNQMIATAYPFINTETNTLDYVYTFYVVKENSILVRPSGPEYIIDPKNIIRIVKSIEMSKIYKDTNVKRTPVTNNIKNQDGIKDKLTNEWIDYINQPFIKPALSILNAEIPQINNLLSEFINTIDALSNVGNIDLVFNKQENETGKSTKEKIIDAINDNEMIQPQLFMDIAFSINPIKKWSGYKSFLSPSNSKSINSPASPGKQLYTLLVGFNGIAKVIRERINYLISTKQIIEDPYENFEGKSVIYSLMKSLKDNNIIEDNKTISSLINEISNNPFDFIKLILNKAKENLSFPLTTDFIKVIFSFIPIDPKPNNETIDKISTTLGNIFSDKANVLSLLKLLETKDTDDIVAIFKDIKNNIPELIKIVGNNAPKQQGILKKLGRAFIDKQALKQLLPSKPGQIDISAIAQSLFTGFSDQEFKNLISKLPPAISSEWPTKLKELDNLINVLSLFIDKQTLRKTLKTGLRSLNLKETKILIIGILNNPLFEKLIKNKLPLGMWENLKINKTEIANILFYLSR